MAKVTSGESKAPAQQPSAEAAPPLSPIDRYFGLTAAGTSVATELRAGLTTRAYSFEDMKRIQSKMV